MSVIFDLDGTLVETEQVWRDVRRAFVFARGGRWRDDAQATMIGMRTNEWAQYIHDDLGVTMPVDEIAKQVIAEVCDALRGNVPILPGAQGALERLAAAFPLGLATSAARPVAETVLETTGWHRFFKVVVSADEVARGKPAPDVYLRAVHLMEADASQTSAVEDSSNGIRSAYNAGLRVIAIPNREFAPDAAALELAARVLTNLDDLDASFVRELFTSARR